MKERIACDNAVDLLAADHKAINKVFTDHAALCEDSAPVAAQRLPAPTPHVVVIGGGFAGLWCTRAQASATTNGPPMRRA
jgi:hypothetical protein